MEAAAPPPVKVKVVDDRPGQARLPSVQAHLPSVQTHLPSVQAHLPSVQTHLPSVQARLPPVQTHLPSVQTHLPSVQSHPQPVQQKQPEPRTSDSVEEPMDQEGLNTGVLEKSEPSVTQVGSRLICEFTFCIFVSFYYCTLFVFS